MRISDWSSDVCSSDLAPRGGHPRRLRCRGVRRRPPTPHPRGRLLRDRGPAGRIGRPPTRRRPGRGAGMTRTDWTAVWGVVAKDLRAVVRSKSVIIPMLAVPVLLMVVLPAAIGFAARATAGVQVERLLGDVPGDLARPILDLPVEEQLIVLVNGYLQIGRAH